jgi:AraC-like DNA-binding protein
VSRWNAVAVSSSLAEHYLRQSTITPSEVSWLLGFQDGNSFIRAFRNWTGTTPGQYRAMAIA